MDFFSAQDKARSTTRKLIVLYGIAIIALIGSIYFVVIFTFMFSGWSGSTKLWYPEIFIGVTAFTLLLIISGTAFRVYQLRKGGSAVAEMLGGRKVSMSTTDLNERKLVNVVEEMSIASGVPVPEIYILDKEPTINAFAAGYTLRDAAVGVTRGTLEQLNRDELQGVIAHEFSHIFNGDMRINIRLIGILNGILCIHLLGMMIMRSGFYSSIGSRSNKNKNQGGILIFGLALLGIGYIGMIFGRMIQAAVSRQREYLADAAAVQYTRNPEGLSGALYKISASFEKPTLKDAHAMEVSHMFFSNSFKSGLDSFFATHPPIQERIKALGSVQIQDKTHTPFITPPPVKDSSQSEHDFGEFMRPEVILAAIGTVTTQNIAQAGSILRGIPESIRNAVHNPLEAQALSFALLMAEESDIEAEQQEIIKNICGNEMDYAVWHIRPYIKHLKPEWHLPVIELSIPALKQLSKEQFEIFREALSAIIHADGKVTLFEYALDKVITHQLESVYAENKTNIIKHKDLKNLSKQLSILISAVAHETTGETDATWEAALKPIQKFKPTNMALLPRAACTFEAVDSALEEVGTANGAVKKYILASLLHAIATDGTMSRREIEWVRAMAVSIDCPLPIMG